MEIIVEFYIVKLAERDCETCVDEMFRLRCSRDAIYAGKAQLFFHEMKDCRSKRHTLDWNFARNK